MKHAGTHHMDTNNKNFSTKILWSILGVLLIYFIYHIISNENLARYYEKTFEHVQHPADSTLIDPVRFSFSYYPATFVDEFVSSKCAYLVGNIRTYTGDWIQLNLFYSNPSPEPEVSKFRINLLPLRLSNNGSSLQLDEIEDYHPSPFDFDVMTALQIHYSSGEKFQYLSSGTLIYFVFAPIAKPCL